MTTICSRLFQPLLIRSGTVGTGNASMTESNPGNEFKEQETKINAKTKDLADLHMNHIDKSEVI